MALPRPRMVRRSERRQEAVQRCLKSQDEAKEGSTTSHMSLLVAEDLQQAGQS